MNQKKRFIRYQAFRDKLQLVIRQISNAELCPLGIIDRHRYDNNRLWQVRLPIKWRDHVSKRIVQFEEAYYAPIVKGPNGEWYSAADMDDLMTKGI
jgi:hypothetical protein